MPRDPAKAPLDDRIRAQHMLEAARDVLWLAAGRTIDDLRSDMPLRRAMINAIQEIGEAASRVSEPGRARLAGVEWIQSLCEKPVYPGASRWSIRLIMAMMIMASLLWVVNS